MKLHSYSDVITNSSTEMFIISGNRSDDVKHFMANIAKILNEFYPDELNKHESFEIVAFNEQDAICYETSREWYGDDFDPYSNIGNTILTYDDSDWPYGVSFMIEDAFNTVRRHLG